MFDPNPGPWTLVLSAFFFPLFFQDSLLIFAWGVNDPTWIAVLKRVFLLLPSACIILGCWMTSIGLVTVIVRQNRREYLTSLIVTWWDLGKTIFMFWGGIFKCVMYVAQSFFTFFRMLALGLFLFFTDIIFLPVNLVKIAGKTALRPGVPWISVFLTVVWTLLEATIFTFVTSGLVVDTLSNIVGNQLSEKLIRAPLFMFMLFIILGSYSVLLVLTEAIKSRNIPTILKIGIVESVAMFVEVVFLYREFVDALVPWFAQHSSGNFELGIVGTIAIASVTWLGVRSMSWFLFAAHGTPLIMGVIQGKGFIDPSAANHLQHNEKAELHLRSFEQIKKEILWIKAQGDEILGSFLLPPLQVLASGINFCVLALTGQHLFELPFRNVRTVVEMRPTLVDVHKTRNHQNEKHSA